MTQVVTIGLDIAKSVFQLHGVDAAGAVLLRKRLPRSRMLAFFDADSDDDAHAFRNIDARAFRYFNAHPWGDADPVDKPA